MNRTIRIAVVVVGLVLGACSAAADDGDASTSTLDPAAQAESDDPATRVLFIGSGFSSYVTGLKIQVPLLAAAADPPLNVRADESVAGGGTLEKLWTEQPTADTIADGDYDIVVMQGSIPLSDVESFKKYARKFVEAARESGAVPILFMAWATEHNDWNMDEIAVAHADIAVELDVPVAPVGLAFERAARERPELKVLARDSTHQSTFGAHLVAYVIYSTMFGVDPPDTVTDLVEGDPITKEQASFLHRIARETVIDYQAEHTP